MHPLINLKHRLKDPHRRYALNTSEDTLLRSREPGVVRPSPLVRLTQSAFLALLTRHSSPQAISSGMLRRPPTNLNRQSEQATILLIREVLQRGIELSEVRPRPSLTL